MTAQLQCMNFRDTGCLSYATTKERENILVLSMYYKLGKYDPSNKYVKSYKNKDILNLYRKITEEILSTTNTLFKICKFIYQIDIRMQNKNKSKNKAVNKTNLTKTI